MTLEDRATRLCDALGIYALGDIVDLMVAAMSGAVAEEHDNMERAALTALSEAVAAERERCAKFVEEAWGIDPEACGLIAKDIREGK